MSATCSFAPAPIAIPQSALKPRGFLSKQLREMDARSRCHITEVNCFRLCRNGPIALVYPEGTYYCSVTPDKCERIAEEHLVGGVPVEEYGFASVPLTPAQDSQECKLPKSRG
jgi:(2Fe-2S) ferredoxin